ncbi:MAG: hypothetical protein ACKOUM_10125 [Sphingopyxis sp.]
MRRFIDLDYGGIVRDRQQEVGMSAIAGIRLRNPAHGRSVTAAAGVLGVTRATLMRMQNSYDIAQTRKRENEIKVMPFKGKPIEPQAAA